MTITRAPASRAARSVGRAASSRAVLVTRPSLTGTFKSSRISTRLPSQVEVRHPFDGERHRLLNSRISAASVHLDPGPQTFAKATVVSSIRFEKPHSLSYHAQTFTSLPSITFVSVES